jgi:Putative Flp pilus-assembly TadE/G-like
MNVRDERGQAIVVMVAFVAALLGVASLAIDAGSWFHSKRQLQAAADAAALAGAQALPESSADARALAIQYLSENGVTFDPQRDTISFSKDITTDDTISVHLEEDAPGFFSRVLGVDKVDVAANAAARSDNAHGALHVAPIAVNWKHPMLACQPLPCSDQTEIDLADLHKPHGGDAAGSFSLIDLDPKSNGSVGASTLGQWITQGFDKYLEPGDYYAVPSANFNSSAVVSAMDISVGQVLLFPVYRSILNPGSNAQFDIIGWVGFHVTGFDANGNPGKVFGWFTRRVSGGIQVTADDTSTPDFGVRVVQLVN